jgi:hypothetical protein
MKRFPSIWLFTLAAILGSLLVAAERPAPGAGLAGKYVGRWQSGEASGDLRLEFKPEAAAAWAVEASFTFEGTSVPTKTKSVRVDGTKVVLEIGWDVQGTVGQSKLSGELTGDTWQGTYASTGAEGESTGTWTAKRQ